MSAKVRAGVLPSILRALLQARAATRKQLQESADPVQKAVLDSRQKALKVLRHTSPPLPYTHPVAHSTPVSGASSADGALQCRELTQVCLRPGRAAGRVIGVLGGRVQLVSNALYGFTGAQTSPLQCLPLADSCLALGAASMRTALATVHAAALNGAPHHRPRPFRKGRGEGGGRDPPYFGQGERLPPARQRL